MLEANNEACKTWHHAGQVPVSLREATQLWMTWQIAAGAACRHTDGRDVDGLAVLWGLHLSDTSQKCEVVLSALRGKPCAEVRVKVGPTDLVFLRSRIVEHSVRCEGCEDRRSVVLYTHVPTRRWWTRKATKRPHVWRVAGARGRRRRAR